MGKELRRLETRLASIESELERLCDILEDLSPEIEPYEEPDDPGFICVDGGFI